MVLRPFAWDQPSPDCDTDPSLLRTFAVRLLFLFAMTIPNVRFLWLSSPWKGNCGSLNNMFTIVLGP